MSTLLIKLLIVSQANKKSPWLRRRNIISWEISISITRPSQEHRKGRGAYRNSELQVLLYTLGFPMLESKYRIISNVEIYCIIHFECFKMIFCEYLCKKTKFKNSQNNCWFEFFSCNNIRNSAIIEINLVYLKTNCFILNQLNTTE